MDSPPPRMNFTVPPWIRSPPLPRISPLTLPRPRDCIDAARAKITSARRIRLTEDTNRNRRTRTSRCPPGHNGRIGPTGEVREVLRGSNVVVRSYVRLRDTAFVALGFLATFFPAAFF